MVNVEKYIRKLLFEYDCVIIPDFGGLLTHPIGAHYDASHSVFLPSTKRVAFNEVLRMDDGLLAYYISVNEQILREEAARHVKKFVDTLQNRLKEGESIQLDSIGCFTANLEGRLVFEPDYHQNFNKEWYGLEGVEAHVLHPDQAIEPFDFVPVMEAEETGLLLYSKTKTKRRWLGWAAAAVISGLVVTASMVFKPLDDSTLSSLNPINSVKDIYSNLFPNDSEVQVQSRHNYPKVNVSPVVAAELPNQEASVPVTEPKKEDKLITPLVPEPVKEVPAAAVEEKLKPGSFYLIAGSFGKISNAKVLKKRLIQNGFQDAEVLGKLDGNLIKVSVGVYGTMDEAMNEKDRVDQITNADSWVFRTKR